MKHCPACRESYPDSQQYCARDRALLSLQDPFHLVGKTLLDKYQIEALVGIGGMGAVYGARHLKIDRRVAFKILLPHLAVGHTDTLALFEREARTAGQLNHENIVDIKDAGQTPDNIAYIVMEWLEGHTLESVIAREGRLSLQRTSQILTQIGAALDAAHARGVVHRDLKPSNVMLIKSGDREHVKVVDFGIAKVVTTTSLSPVSRPMGTPHYASPEQLRVGEKLDGRSDIYSLGVMLFQMLSGRCPFNAQSIHELIRLQMQEPPPLLRQVRPDTPVAVENLVNRMLAKDPQIRPQTAGEVARLFHQAIASPGEEPVPRKTSVTTRRIGVATNRDETLPLDEVPTEPIDGIQEHGNLETRPLEEIGPAQPPRRVLAPVVLMALAVLAIGAALVYRYRGQTTIATPPATATPAAATTPALVQVMSYRLGVYSKGTKQKTVQSGAEALHAGQSFQFLFTPASSGYLYIIGPDDKAVPMSFLTAHPVKDSGVGTNQVEAGTEFSFPGGRDNWIEPARDELYTVVFSHDALTSPAFLAARAGRKLTTAEQGELSALRTRMKTDSRVVEERNGNQSTIKAESERKGPLIFDIPIKLQNSRTSN